MSIAITRLIVLIVLLLNQTLITIGFDALPFSEDDIYEGVSSVATVVAALWTYWKNNDITKEAEKGTEHMQHLKNKRGA